MWELCYFRCDTVDRCRSQYESGWEYSRRRVLGVVIAQNTSGIQSCGAKMFLLFITGFLNGAEEILDCVRTCQDMATYVNNTDRHAGLTQGHFWVYYRRMVFLLLSSSTNSYLLYWPHFQVLFLLHNRAARRYTLFFGCALLSLMSHFPGWWLVCCRKLFWSTTLCENNGDKAVTMHRNTLVSVLLGVEMALVTNSKSGVLLGGWETDVFRDIVRNKWNRVKGNQRC